VKIKISLVNYWKCGYDSLFCP